MSSLTDNPAVIAGSLVDVRNVGTHKEARLDIRIPAERAQELLRDWGWATGVDPIPVAVARLVVPDESA